ncbi:MAG: hypothetical protein U9R60_02355 [Bacteroidota bacterium]|nr:hypothetical protein [Bacteroidota bacterium]
MKRYFWPLFVIAILIGTSCQPRVNVEKEKEAIMAMIQRDIEGFQSLDKDLIFSNHVQDGEEVRLELGVYGYNIYHGWDQIETLLSDFLEGNEYDSMENSKENVILRITGNAAWLVCDNTTILRSGDVEDVITNMQILFLEKVKGEWKISFSAYYSKPVEVPGIPETFH